MLKIATLDSNTFKLSLEKIADDGRTLFHRNLVPSTSQRRFQLPHCSVSSSRDFFFRDGPHRVVHRVERTNILAPKARKQLLWLSSWLNAPVPSLVEAQIHLVRSAATPTGECVADSWRHYFDISFDEDQRRLPVGADSGSNHDRGRKMAAVDGFAAAIFCWPFLSNYRRFWRLWSGEITVEQCATIVGNFRKRLRKCIAIQGGNFEHML